MTKFGMSVGVAHIPPVDWTYKMGKGGSEGGSNNL